jgi:6-phosphogluconolactonase
MSILSASICRGLLAAAAVCVSTTVAFAQPDPQAVVAAVYTSSNAPEGNAVLVYPRTAAGNLGAPLAVPTGGTGTGGGLGNQGAVFLSRNAKRLLVVNAGSNTISAFAVARDGLRLTDVVPSGGVQPVSLTEHRGIVYVLNAGSDAITGFTLDHDGRLTPLAGSTRGLGDTGTAPAQVSFSPDGGLLVVTEKATNQIVTFVVDRDGLASEGLVQPSSGMTPFGFAFGKRNHVFVSEAFGGAPLGSAVSSYVADADGVLTAVTASAATLQTAACWVVVTPNGRFVYTTNTGSASVSAFAAAADGTITLTPASGRAGETGAGPIDAAISGNGRFLYTLNGGSDTISSFEVLGSGALRPIGGDTTAPIEASGLAAR